MPAIRQWLSRLQQVGQQLQGIDERLQQMVEAGNDAGGGTVEEQVRLIAARNEVLEEFRSRQIQIKDIDRGLLDFPAIVAGREVFLCWEQDEDDIEFWHELDTGYAGRERL